MGRAVSLRVQLLVLQVAIVLLVVAATGAVASTLQQRQLRDAYLDRMTAVALSVARLPAIIDAFDDPDPAATIQPIAEVIREASDVTYVVVTDDAGVRYSHPEPARIGEQVSTDPSVPLSGEVWTGTQTGTLGESWRVKVPVFGPDGDVVGTASVGILESDLAEDLADDLGWLLAALSVAAALGVVCAAVVTRVVRRRIFRLEPEEIASLLETRDAMLHGISEGVVALDREGGVVLVNDEAQRLLGLVPADAVGRPARDVLDPQLLALVPDLTAADPSAAGPSADGGPGTVAPDDGGVLVLAGERVLLARADRARVDGRAVGTVLVLRDHTELHALLRDLDGARGLTDALRAQSHEFANKLHVVSGLLELGQPDEAVAFIERAGHGGLLTASGVAPGVHSPEVGALLLVKATTTRERGTRLDVAPATHLAAPSGPDGAALHGDVLTVLGNLLDNAVDATGPGGCVRVLVTDRDRPDGSVHVVVEDDGPGIPARHRSSVLSAGWTTKADPQGRGIGLALVHRVVERRGGDVTVTTSDLGGARLAVRLPAAVPAVTA
ncbi:ATP-binding protein [Cellulosimicrobium marinum]|uniref:ATP-binding protein n=1 Tax=Cellulosimicrobium marinum TaxID=1638992 RepID=UPI001E623D4D|nr:sensor histidine kinase [Cellulosimicrobium marinum]MCB7135116.1 sensor histidine kinase [Cellulosimicrobium marinum]